MNLVIGSTGMLGGEICRLLSTYDKPVRAMVRESSDENKVKRLIELGVRVVRGDLIDLASIKPVLEGVTSVVATVSSMPFSYDPEKNDIQNVDCYGMLNLIDMAKAAGVQRFVYTSFSANIDREFPLRNAKRKVEQHLRRSEMIYTILRPSYFMEVWLSPAAGFDVSNFKVQIFGEGTNPVSYISYKDVAKFAVESLHTSVADDSILELGGPEPISQLDVVRIFERISQHEFDLETVPVESLDLLSKQTSDPMELSFVALKRCIANGDAIEMRDTLQSFPIKLNSVEDHAHDALDALHLAK